MTIITSPLVSITVLCLLLLQITCITATPCIWQSSGGTYDLTPLTATGNQRSYYILDGDLECTVEQEPSFSYTWNFCAPVTPASVPGACSNVGKNGVALQYLESGQDSFCYIIGRYDTAHPHMYLSNPENPSGGVSIEYPTGERCTAGLMRSTIIDVQCSTGPTTTLHAISDKPCEYRLTMKSIHGCPKECAVTEAGDLCNNHGHCGYDKVRRTSYCFCNTGYYGDSCESTTDPNGSGSFYDGHSVQVFLLITLLIIVGALVYSVIKMSQRIKQARSEAASDGGYGHLPLGSDAMGDSIGHGIDAEMTHM